MPARVPLTPVPSVSRRVPSGARGFLGILVLGGSAACGASGPSSPPLPAVDASSPVPAFAIYDGGGPLPTGTTSAFDIVTVAGKQKLYLPQQTLDDAGMGTISVVDLWPPESADGGPGDTPALVTSIELMLPDGGSAIATATGGDSSMVVAASASTSALWFIDPTNDRVVATSALDSSFAPSSVSGGGYVNGVVVDSASRRAILGTWDGFASVNLDTYAITTHIAAPASANFAFDSVNNWILDPFYVCSDNAANGQSLPNCSNPNPASTGRTSGLDLVDIASRTVYSYESAVGPDPENVAIDPTTNIAAVSSEGDGSQYFIDFSRAVIDPVGRTVAAPESVLLTSVPGLQGVTIEPTSHIAFWEQELGSYIAAADLTTPGGASASWVQGRVPAPPQEGAFMNGGDPQGIAVAVGPSGGAFGLVFDSHLRWLARIDLAQMLQYGHDGKSTELTAAQMSACVTFLDVLTSE